MHVPSTGNCTTLINEDLLRSAESDGLTGPVTKSTGIGLHLADMLESSPASISREATRHTLVQFGDTPRKPLVRTRLTTPR